MVMLDSEKSSMKLYTDLWKKKVESLEMRAETSRKKIVFLLQNTTSTIL